MQGCSLFHSLLQVLTDMDSYSVKMNSHIFTAFLQAATTVPLSPDQVEAVFGAMARFRACEQATAFVYTALLTFCAKQAPDRALDVWHAMHEVCMLSNIAQIAFMCHLDFLFWLWKRLSDLLLCAHHVLPCSVQTYYS